MKKVLGLVAVAGLIAAASSAFGATIVNSKHDLSVGWSATSTQICIYCHAPHNANKTLPLWNRSNPAGSGFTLYSGVGMQNVSFKSGFTSDSTSLFCMSCHDGTTNLNAVHNAGVLAAGATYAYAGGQGRFTGANAGVFATGTIGTGNQSYIGGTNLTKTHPINFPVAASNNAQADLNVGTGPAMGPGVAAGVTADGGWAAGKTYPLFKSTERNVSGIASDRFLECGSCHAVHDSAYSPFLRDTMAQSKLCLGCHNK